MVKDMEAWLAAVLGITKSWTWLSDWTTTAKVGLLMTSKRTYVETRLLGLLLPVPPSPWQTTIDPHLCRRPSNTHRQAQSPVGSLLLSPGSCWAQDCFLCPPRLSFPSPMDALWSNPAGLPGQIPCGFPVPWLDLQAWKPNLRPRTFTIVQELLWYYCCPVCELLAGIEFDFIVIVPLWLSCCGFSLVLGFRVSFFSGF